MFLCDIVKVFGGSFKVGEEVFVVCGIFVDCFGLDVYVGM